MEAFLLSTALVAVAELGDKTQLLAFMLAARFRTQLPILWGILVATLANHALAGALGVWLAATVPESTLRYALAAGFLAMALWLLVPDRLDESEAPAQSARGAFLTTLVAFFIAEMGDKTQIATVALAARFDAVVAVIAGSTLGLMLANVPAIYLGQRFSAALPLVWIRRLAAAGFALTGIATALWA
jgi:putative Ca2+/H+ antiporter (TMEM165/GDT1 family)